MEKVLQNEVLLLAITDVVSENDVIKLKVVSKLFVKIFTSLEAYYEAQARDKISSLGIELDSDAPEPFGWRTLYLMRNSPVFKDFCVDLLIPDSRFFAKGHCTLSIRAHNSVRESIKLRKYQIIIHNFAPILEDSVREYLCLLHSVRAHHEWEEVVWKECFFLKGDEAGSAMAKLVNFINREEGQFSIEMLSFYDVDFGETGLATMLKEIDRPDCITFMFLLGCLSGSTVSTANLLFTRFPELVEIHIREPEWTVADFKNFQESIPADRKYKLDFFELRSARTVGQCQGTQRSGLAVAQSIGQV
eukprot:Platyproteum_vivax@DN6709_c0_g1_i4.p1